MYIKKAPTGHDLDSSPTTQLLLGLPFLCALLGLLLGALLGAFLGLLLTALLGGGGGKYPDGGGIDSVVVVLFVVVVVVVLVVVVVVRGSAQTSLVTGTLTIFVTSWQVSSGICLHTISS